MTLINGIAARRSKSEFLTQPTVEMVEFTGSVAYQLPVRGKNVRNFV